MDGTSGYRVMAALLAHLGALAAGACAAPSPQVPVTWAPSPQVPVPQVPACAAVCCRTRLVHAGAQAVLSEAGLQCRMIGPFFAWNRLGKAARAGHVGQLPQVQCAHGRAFAAGAWAACTEPWRPPVHPAGSRGAVNRVRGGAWAAPETQASLIFQAGTGQQGQVCQPVRRVVAGPGPRVLRRLHHRELAGHFSWPALAGRARHRGRLP